MRFGALFGENILQDSEPRSRGDITEAVGWLDKLHPLLRQPRKTDLYEGEGRGRVLCLSLLLLFSFFALGIRLVYLTLFRGEEYLLAAEGNRIVSVPLYPERGVITDRNGEVIADSRSGFLVTADPRICVAKCDLGFLAEALSEDVSELAAVLDRGLDAGFATVVLGSNVSRDVAVLLEVNSGKIPGVKVETVPIRNYPYPYELSSVLGYLGGIGSNELKERLAEGYELGGRLGKSGLELAYESLLRGSAGRLILEKDALGRVVRELARQAPESGKTLQTTLDLLLQRFAYQSLAKWVKSSGGKGGALVITDVNTGDILSLVSYPGFDNNQVEKFLNDKSWPLFNRAISGAYPPGSTFKLVTGSAALEEGVVNASTVIWDRGSISVGPWVFPGWKPSGLGPLTVVDAISWSSDIYFYTVAGGYGSQPGVGPEKLADWARKYGLGEPTGIDLLGESGGIVPDPEWKWAVKGKAWFQGDTYHMGIGQGDVLLTPLQLNVVTVAVANGGRLLRPRLVAGDSPVKIRREGFVSAETLALIRQGMRKSITDGPNRFANSSVVAIAGKTGTAEVSPEDNPHSWFTAFAPYDNPQVAITVLIENGAQLGAYHPSVWVAKEVLEYYFMNLHE